jgi:hypothetical protein
MAKKKIPVPAKNGTLSITLVIQGLKYRYSKKNNKTTLIQTQSILLHSQAGSKLVEPQTACV